MCQYNLCHISGQLILRYGLTAFFLDKFPEFIFFIIIIGRQNCWNVKPMEMQKITHKIQTDLHSEFDRYINLNNLIGQNRACQTLQTAIDEHHWNNLEEARFPFKPILIYGKHSCATIARAISNSFGNIEYIDVVGQLIGYGIDLTDHFKQIDEHITYHIQDIDKMAYYYKQPLYILVRDSILRISEIPGYHRAQEKRFTGLLILSSEDETKITSTMEKHCGAVIHVADYDDEDVCEILEQRIALYGLKIEEKEKLVDAIVHIVNCDVRLCIELLHWSYRCCRAMGKYIITLQHLNKTLKMWG